MGMIITPPPSIVSGQSLTINLDKTSDVSEYAITFNGIPPVLAKYIAYDNLTPRNPFIATVEDGLGNILLDGGFPKWYNDNCNSSWMTYLDLSPSFKYLFDAITFISNKSKVLAGNKDILIIGDHLASDSYAVKSVAGSSFKTSIDKVCSIKGFNPTYLDCSDFDGIVLNPSYAYLEQFSCILFFSTAYTNIQKISNSGIASLIAYRENGNGIFFITDHGDRNLTSVSEAAGTTLNYSGFYRTANFIVTNFGCYFTGTYNRTPVNVGYLRANYGNHILWENLLDTDYISAGGSESKVVVTAYPFYTGPSNKEITSDGYIQVKILMKMVDGSTKMENYTYGKNVPEIINFSDKTNIPYTGDIYNNGVLYTFLKNHFLNFRIDYAGVVSGIIKLDNIPVGTFVYNGTGVDVTKTFNQSKINEIILKDSQDFTIQITSPLSYTKNLKILFPKPTDSMRPNQVIAFVNNHEFKNSDSTSKIRNVNRLLNAVLPLNHFSTRFQYYKIPEYFKTPGVILIPGNPDQTIAHAITYNFGSTASSYAMEIIDGVYWIATDNGIITSPDYENWSHVPESGAEYISSIFTYNNYIVSGLVSNRVLLSRDKGLTWNIITIGDSHISSVYITTISGVDYLFVGTQQGSVLKYNLNTSTLVYTKSWVATFTYIRDMVWFNDRLIVMGYNCIAYITDSGIVTKIDIPSIGILNKEDFNYLCVTPTSIYASSPNHVIKSLDGITWTVVTVAAFLAGKSKTVMIYNPDRDEFIFGYDNDLKFGITKDFINITYVETYKTGSSSNKISEIIWDSTYSRYLILSKQLTLLNYII